MILSEDGALMPISDEHSKNEFFIEKGILTFVIIYETITELVAFSIIKSNFLLVYLWTIIIFPNSLQLINYY